MPKLRILYFINSRKPTNFEKQRAAHTGQTVVFLNPADVKPDDKAEECDAVMGAVIPQQYAHEYVWAG
jgi:hypothetical protein